MLIESINLKKSKKHINYKAKILKKSSLSKNDGHRNEQKMVKLTEWLFSEQVQATHFKRNIALLIF